MLSCMNIKLFFINRLYLNYAKEHWTKKGENPPVGLILCTGGKKTLVKYALQGISNKILTTKYQTKLPSTKLLTQEIEKTKRIFALRKAQSGSSSTGKNASSINVKTGTTKSSKKIKNGQKIKKSKNR